MSYYDNSQWSAGDQAGWDHQTPPVRSGASSAVPREEASAFSSQFEEVDRAVDNLVKSGKMFGAPNRHGRMGPNAGQRGHAMNDFSGDARGGHQSSNLQNFYASQRHQSSRGSNEAEQMIQAKRRMAAQRERELRNYHQEQQFNRTVMSEMSGYGANKPERSLSPGSMSEEDRRELIARQRSALYGEGPFEGGGYVDETGTPRPGMPGSQPGPAGMRGHSPLTYEYGRTPPVEGGAQAPNEGGPGSQSAGQNQRSRANSTSSPQSNPAGNKGVFDAPGAQQSSRTSTSSPGESGGSAVAPIGTRPSGPPGSAVNPALNKRETTPLPSPLSHPYNSGANNDNTTPTTTGASNPNSAAAEGSMGLSGWGNRSGVWGSSNKSGLGVQASVWG